MSDAATQGAAPTVRTVSAHYRSYAMGLLLSIYIVNVVDRQVVNIFAESIKNEPGPLAVGALSDVLAINTGMGSAEGVRWALIASVLANIGAAACFWFARESIRDEMED